MKNFLARYYVIFLLIALFSAPGITAWYFFNHPDLLSKAATNKGTLINPPVLLSTLEKSSKWHLVFWTSQSCDRQCIQQLDKLAKIRLALGRQLYSVDLDLILDKGVTPLSETMLASLHEQGFHVQTGVVPIKNADSILIANPDDFLILTYDANTKPGDVFHDLKQLLNNPNQGAKT